MLDIITELLNVDKHDVEIITTTKVQNILHIHITLKKQWMICPCGHSSPMTFKEYRLKNINHSLLLNVKTQILYRARRYRCELCKTTLYEPNPFAAPYQKTTHNLATQIIEKLMRPEATFSSVAKDLHVSVTTVMNHFDRLVDHNRRPLPRVLCIDELYYSRHASYKYACLFVDFKTQKLVEMFESRHKFRMLQYLDMISETERNRVELVCIDMYDPYRQLVKRRFKKAKCCIDKFHIIKLFNDHLDKVRLRVMRQFPKYSNEYYLLKKFRFLLFKSRAFDINHESKFNRKLNGYYNYARLLNKMLTIHNDLYEAYWIRKQIQYFLDHQNLNLDQINQHYDALINQIKTAQVVEMLPLVGTLNNWRGEIINSFVWINHRRISNGPIEAINGTLKKMKNNANGFRNFKRFRARAFLIINKKYSFSAKNNTIAMKHPSRGPYKKR